MTKPYAPMRGSLAKYYACDPALVRYPSGNRPNKVAVGMTYTHARKGSKQGDTSRDASTLSIYGTLDKLARTNMMKAYRDAHYKQVHRWVKK